MKYINMKRGRIYKIKREGEGYYWLILLHKLEKTSVYTNISMTNEGDIYTDKNSKFCSDIDTYEIEEASSIEAEWLRQCKAATKFIPFKKIKLQHYEIY